MPTYLANFDGIEGNDQANGVTNPTSGGSFGQSNTTGIWTAAGLDTVINSDGLGGSPKVTWWGLWFNMADLRLTEIETDFQGDPTRALQISPNIINTATLRIRTSLVFSDYGTTTPLESFEIYLREGVRPGVWGPGGTANGPFRARDGIDDDDREARLLFSNVDNPIQVTTAETDHDFALDVGKLNATIQRGAWNEILVLAVRVRAHHRDTRNSSWYGDFSAAQTQAFIDANCARLITTETAFHTGHEGGPKDGRTRAVHDDRLGLPIFSKDRVRDGFTHEGLLVRPKDFDPEDEPDEFKTPDSEGAFERDD